MNSLDQVILVNEQDEPIGTMDRVEAHRREGKLHRAISVYLFNDQDELLIQKRSAQKIVGAGQWANTCCGNVRPGESYEACAYRRLREELGVEGVELQPTQKTTYFVACNDEFSEREIDQMFVGKYQGSPRPNHEEVVDWRWIDIKVLSKEIGQENQSFNKNYAPWFEILFNKLDIKSIN